jgi:hypothetical protein
MSKKFGLLAQLVEQLTFNQLVEGSNPSQPTNFLSLLLTVKYSIVAGWSSLVARRAHNPKVVGSNPAPATSYDLPHR